MARSIYKYDPTYVGPYTTFKKRLDGKLEYIYNEYVSGTGKRVGPRKYMTQKDGESPKQFFKRVQDRKDKQIAKGSAAQWSRGLEVKKNARTWTNEWLKQNLNKYKPREVDKFLEDFKKAWAKEVKEKGYKKIGPYSPINKLGFPGLSVHGDEFKIKNMNIPVIAKDTGKAFRKVFFENLLINNPEFKKGLDDYFDFFLENKSGKGYNQFNKVTLPQGAKDAMFWLSPDSGVFGVGRADMFAKIPAYSKIFREYQDKFRRSNDITRSSLFKLEKKLGLPRRTLSNEMRKEHKALAKLFDVKQLPEELKLGYSIEHTQGLAAAVRSDNPNILKAARKDLAGMTWRRNMDLGWRGGGFEKTRGEYIKNIQEGLLNKKDMTKDIKNLNKMVSTEYKDIGAPKDIYSIKNNKLVTSSISPATTQEQRFGQYFSQLAKEKAGAKAIASQIKTSPDLLKLIQDSPGNILMSVGRTLGCKVSGAAEGGRIGLATGTSLIKCISSKVENDPIGSSQKIANIDETAPGLTKIKNAATGFLNFVKRGGLAGKIALGLGTVAAGVGAGALVKQFRNDDPSTYLTNDSQMEGMIISDVEQKGEEVDDNILLDNQFKLEAAAAAGLTAPIAKKVYQTARGVGEAGPLPEGVGRTRAALGLEKGVLGKGLWALGAPIIQVPSTLGYIAQDVREGKDVGEIATNPLNYLGASFMNPAVKALGKAGMSRGLLGIASLGLAGTAALPALSIGAGLATLGTLGYQGYKLFTGKNRSDEDFFR
jgi:hypothetical protein